LETCLLADEGTKETAWLLWHSTASSKLSRRAKTLPRELYAGASSWFQFESTVRKLVSAVVEAFQIAIVLCH